jgi:hypothetical protein
MRFLAPLISGCVASVLAASSTAMAQSNAEACVALSWGYLKSQRYEFGAINMCPYAVSISFKTRTGQVVQGDVPPGQGFSTGLTIDSFEAERKSKGWIATVCPAATVPSLRPSDDTWDAVLRGQYDCKAP